MPRPPRSDAPGVLHHAVNRGLARRTIFETRRDIRYFQSLLAREVRAGRIEILAFVILPTHFHILVRSLTGELDRVMQRVLNLYARYFNRTRKRDGPLFRSRYKAKRVASRRYRLNLIRYIDQNATAARLAPDPTVYPYGSATHYVARRRPPWLSTKLIDAIMGSPRPEDRAHAYALHFGRRLRPDEVAVLRRRIEQAGASDDDWDDLVDAAPPRVLDWMRRKARLADGTKPGPPYVGDEHVDAVLDRARAARGDLTCRSPGGRTVDAWPFLRVGLLRDLSGLSLAEISRRVDWLPAKVSRGIQQHARLLGADAGYAEVAGEVAAACLQSGE